MESFIRFNIAQFLVGELHLDRLLETNYINLFFSQIVS
jgi:hypothetical protein